MSEVPGSADDFSRDAPPPADLAGALHLGLWAISAGSMKPLWMTTAAESLLGWPRGEWRSRGEALLRETAGGAWERLVTAVRDAQAAGAPRDVELRIVRSDGAVAWLGLRVAPSSSPDRVVAFVEDITRRHEAEDIGREHAERLVRAQRLEAMGRVAGRVAHDFNNLLTVIGGYAGLLANRFPAGSDGQREALEIVTASANATEQTRHLLAFSRAQGIDLRLVDLREELRVLGPTIAKVLEPGMRLEITADQPAEMRLDPAALEQILVHLALRARDLRPHGDALTLVAHTEVYTSERAARLRVAAGARVVLEVLDGGPPLTDAEIADVFDPLRASAAGNPGLVALGAVNAIVVQSGGVMEVEAAPPHGTRVRLSWPRWSGAAGDALDAPARRRVLLIEDEPSVREVAHEWLSEQGFDVLLAAGRDEALALAATPGRLDAVIADLNLRDGDSGDAVAERIALERPGVRILLISGGPERPGRGDGRVFLAKPFDLDELGRTLRTLLELPA